MELKTLVEQNIAPMGFELVELELAPGGGLRLAIDFLTHDKPVTIEDCVAVSNHLGRVFLVEEVDYARMEVSSPGLDRPLTKKQDYERFVGQTAKMKLRLAKDGQKKFLGILRGIEGDTVLLEQDGVTHELAFANIERARLVPVFD